MVQPSVADFYQHQSKFGAAAASQLLFSWLSDDRARNQLIADMVRLKVPIFFASSASQRDLAQTDVRDFDWIDGPRSYAQTAVLLAHPDHVHVALQCNGAIPKGSTPAQTQALLPYSNSPYQGLGGYFMLALDVPSHHDPQRQLALKLLQSIPVNQYDALATLAFKAGALAPLKQHDFDLTALAEGIAVRFVVNVFGFAQKDAALVLECTRKIGRGLQYQIMGRHFVFEPGTMPESRAALARMATRATAIIHLYSLGTVLTREQREDKEEIDADLERMACYRFQQDASGDVRTILGKSANGAPPFVPLLQQLAAHAGSLGDTSFGSVEQGLIAASLVGGSVTNIQNAICICLGEFFKLPPDQLTALRRAAVDERSLNPDAQWRPKDSHIVDMVKEALRISPPVVFVPRRANYDFDLSNPNMPLATASATYATPPTQNQKVILKNTVVLVALAGVTAHDKALQSGKPPMPALAAFRFNATQGEMRNEVDSEKNGACPFSKIMGGAPLLKNAPAGPGDGDTYNHSCPGMMMSMYVIAYAVRQLLVLPSLTQRVDPDTDKPYGLEKRWGFQSAWYPMSYQREALLVQTPLQTVLPIRAPVDVHSQALRQVIAQGAPFIEKVLQDSQMVHFASFMFLENDSKLVLFTMYDGDFDTYIGHFAKEFGHLFDRFFSHMAVQPPMPIREHPFEFVQYLKRFVLPPVENYYFSAYPETPTHRIVQSFTRQFDFNVVRGQK